MDAEQANAALEEHAGDFLRARTAIAGAVALIVAGASAVWLVLDEESGGIYPQPVWQPDAMPDQMTPDDITTLLIALTTQYYGATINVSDIAGMVAEFSFADRYRADHIVREQVAPVVASLPDTFINKVLTTLEFTGRCGISGPLPALPILH